MSSEVVVDDVLGGRPAQLVLPAVGGALAAMKWKSTTSKKSRMPMKLENMASCTSEIIFGAEEAGSEGARRSSSCGKNRGLKKNEDSFFFFLLTWWREVRGTRQRLKSISRHHRISKFKLIIDYYKIL